MRLMVSFPQCLSPHERRLNPADYKKLDSRLGTNEDLAAYVAECHRQGIRVILDGVFNHTGRSSYHAILRFLLFNCRLWQLGFACGL